MSTDDYLYFDEETYPALPAGPELLLYEPGNPLSENLISRGRFVAAAAAGGLALLGAGALAGASSAAPSRSQATPRLTGLARQGILVWDTGSEPAQLNPIGPANDPPVRFPTLWNSSSLFRFTNNREGVVFDLARAFKAERDGTRWDIFLRPGVTWHDGTPFTARDVAASYNAAANTAYASTWVGFVARLREAEAIADLTVRFHMRRPDTWWLYVMAAIPIVKAGDVPNRDLLARKPVGTGPFMLQEWRSGDRMIFAANPRWHGNKANKYKRGQPRIKGIQYVTVPDANTRVINLRNGQTALTAEVAPAALADLQKRGIKVYAATNTPNRLFYYYPQRPDYAPAPAPAGSKPRPEWADINNRKALAYALDRKQIAEVAFGGKAVPATNPLAPGSLFYNPKLVGYGPRADIRKARDFLARASVKINRTLDFVIRGTGAGPVLDAAQVMQANWKAIGVDVEIFAVDGAEQSLRGRQQNFDINMLLGVSGPSAGRSPNSWLFKLTQGTPFFGLRDAPAELPELVNTITGSLDRAKVQAAMSRLQQIEIDLCCHIGVVYPDYFEAQGVPLQDYGVLNLGYLPYRVEEARIG